MDSALVATGVAELTVDDDQLDCDREECTATFFEEKDVCVAILERALVQLPRSCNVLVPATDPILPSFALFEKHIQKYQEMPQLLKPHVGDLVAPLMTMVLQRMPSLEALSEARDERDTAAAIAPAAPPAGGPEYTLIHQGTSITSAENGIEYDVYDVDAPRTPLHHACRLLYVVVKVTGAKSCTSYFPHDVKMFELLCYVLMHWQAAPPLRREWEVRYCLLLWLCNLILVPFAIHTIDSSLNQSGSATLSDQLLNLAIGLLSDTSRCREGAALLIARLLSRADGEAHRDSFFQWAVSKMAVDDNALAQKSSHSVELYGALHAVALAMKLGKRHELLPFVPTLIPLVCRLAERYTADAKLCKTAVKVAQRLALCLLRQTSAPWRYVKHVGSLEVNLQQNTTTSDKSSSIPGTEELGRCAVAANDAPLDDEAALEEGSDADGIEDVVGLLIECLSHPDTIVRWSAAKGIGRLCARLPKAMADDIFDAFTEVFQVHENDSGWHGGMLALAELCRRSILLPARFEMVVPIVAKGLVYDLGRGTYSVGSHVRDAACYVCWSVGRAYDAVDLAPHVAKLSASLVVASLFDREVNVRRAASAALQECVGRLGNFPNGIDLVTTMDFYSLATMRSAFLTVAPKIAAYDAYRSAMLDSLIDVKLMHWDKDVRRRASESLGLVAPLCVAHVVNHVVPNQLLPRVRDASLSARHGAILAIAECVANLPASVWPQALIQSMANIVPYLESGRHFRGRGGEFLRQASLRLLEAAASVQLPLPETVEVEKVSGEKGKARTLGKLQVFYEDTWKQILEWLQIDAVASYRVFARNYYAPFSEGFHGKVMSQLLESTAVGKSALERRGSVLALGALPPALLLAPTPPPPATPTEADPATASSGAAATPTPLYLHLVLASLRTAAEPEANPDLRDAETRRNAVEAMVRVVTSLPIHADDLSSVTDPTAPSSVTDPTAPSSVTDPTAPSSVVITRREWDTVIMPTLRLAFADYAVDKRGDVGSFVRIQAMQSCVSLFAWAFRDTEISAASTMEPAHAVELLGHILQQSMEKIDKVRAVAGQALFDVLSANHGAVARSFTAATTSSSSSNSKSIANDVMTLHRVVTQSGIVDWAAAGDTFRLLAPQLLQTGTFSRFVLDGIVVSVGGLSVHVLKPSLEALLAAFNSVPPQPDAAPLEATETSTPSARLSAQLIEIAAKHAHEDRYVVPLCTTIDKLMGMGLFAHERDSDVVDILAAEMKHFSTDIQKLLPLVPVLGTLCRADDNSVRTAAWQLALTMLASRYPKVRAKMGTELYTALLFIDKDNQWTAAMQKLTTVQWDDSSAVRVRGARNEMYDLLRLEKPLKDSAADLKDSVVASAKLRPGSYSYLVHEAGY